MTPKPISDGSGPIRVVPIRVVVVTMDSHLSGAAARAEAELRHELPGLQLAVHAADEWGSDPAALDACHRDIAQGDIVVATMLFLEDHIRAVQPALAARRDHCDAMLCCMSANEVTRLTRLGRFDMSQEATGALAMLKKLRGAKPGAKATNGVGSDGKAQMRMLRRLPKLMKFIPGTAQDVRTYFLALQYWLAGSDENLANLVRMLVGKYCDGAKRALRPVAAPIVYPDVGLYHPDVPGRITEALTALPGWLARTRAGGQGNLLPLPLTGSAGTVGLLLLRSYLISGNAAHYDGVIAALEAKGLRVIPAFASGLDQRPAIEQYFMQDGVAAVHAVVSLTGFSLVGGPAYNDSRAAEDILTRLDVPYVTAHPVEFQTLDQWQSDARGLLPVEATMMVALPELDGGIVPMTFGGRCGRAQTASPCAGCDGKACARDMVPHTERAATLAGRVARLVALQRTARASKRIATVLFNFPPNAGAIGTAAYLGVFASLHNVLAAMQGAGYTVEVPATVDDLRAQLIEGNAGRYGTDANVAARIPLDDHVRRQPWLNEIEATWGAAPGRQLTDGASLFVLGAQFGNVFVGLQPAFGYEGDPMRLLFERGFAPTHAFNAFYRWIAEDFGAHAVLHFGTHGALEFMPGKQAGLSAECWPDRLIGSLPNFNLYASNNPSEGMIAKRRANATLISYLTPPVAHAGLYRGLQDLKASLDRWRALEPDADPDQRAALAALVQAQAATVNLAEADPAWTDAEAELARLGTALIELEYTLIPHGLHVIGQPPSAQERTETLDAAGVTDPAERARLDALLAHDHEIPASAARAGRRLRPPGARRRPAAHHRGPAHRAQPARLRPLPHAQRLRRAGRRPPGRPPAGPPRRRRQRAARNHRHGPLGHRQPQDRRRPHRPGPLADGRRPPLRQLRPPLRRATDPAVRTRPRPRGRDHHPVRHLPRPAAPADPAPRRGRPARRSKPTNPAPRTSSASTRWPSRRRMAAISNRLPCASSAMRTELTAATSTRWSAAASGRTRTNWPTPTSAARASPMASPAARNARTPSSAMCWPASKPPTRTSTASSSASPPWTTTSIRWAASPAPSAAPAAESPPRSTSATRPAATAPSAPCPNRSPSKPAPAP